MKKYMLKRTKDMNFEEDSLSNPSAARKSIK